MLPAEGIKEHALWYKIHVKFVVKYAMMKVFKLELWNLPRWATVICFRWFSVFSCSHAILLLCFYRVPVVASWSTYFMILMLVLLCVGYLISLNIWFGSLTSWGRGLSVMVISLPVDVALILFSLIRRLWVDRLYIPPSGAILVIYQSRLTNCCFTFVLFKYANLILPSLCRKLIA